MKIDTELCPWEEIHGFKHEREFNDFLKWLDEQIRERIAKEILSLKTQIPYNIRDKWFVHIKSGKVWRLIWPDITTLTGAFKRYVENYNDTWTKVEAFCRWQDVDLFKQWLIKQIKLEKAKRLSNHYEDPTMSDGEYLQVDSGQVWEFSSPDYGFRGLFQCISIVNKHEKLARLKFLFKEHLDILKPNKGRAYGKSIEEILADFKSCTSIEECFNTTRSHYQSLLGGYGTLERLTIYNEDGEIQEELNNYLAELMDEICSLLDIEFSRLPRSDEGYPPGHPYWSIK